MTQSIIQQSSAKSPKRVWWLILPLLFIVTIPVWIGFCLQFSLWILAPVDFTIFGLLVFYCACLGFWMGLGSAWWRWIVIAIASPLLGFFSGYDQGREQIEFHFFSLSIIALVGLTTLGLRVWKGNLELVTDQDDCVEALRFGIKDIFLWTTSIGVFLGIGRIAVRFVTWNDLSPGRISLFLSIFCLALSMSIAIVVNIWAMFGNQISITKVTTLILVTAAAMLVNYLLSPNGFFFASVTLIAQILLLFMLFVLRRQGWRFVKALS